MTDEGRTTTISVSDFTLIQLTRLYINKDATTFEEMMNNLLNTKERERLTKHREDNNTQ